MVINSSSKVTEEEKLVTSNSTIPALHSFSLPISQHLEYFD